LNKKKGQPTQINALINVTQYTDTASPCGTELNTNMGDNHFKEKS